MHLKEQQFIRIESLSVPLPPTFAESFPERSQILYEKSDKRPARLTKNDAFTKAHTSS